MRNQLTSRMPALTSPLAAFENRLARLMEPFLSEESWWDEAKGFMPRVDVAETADEIQVTAEVPGMKPEDVTVEIRNGELWISGEKHAEHEEMGKTFHRVECSRGEFRRIISLPAAADAENVEAGLENGVLKVRIPKSENVKPKSIPIKSGNGGGSPAWKASAK